MDFWLVVYSRKFIVLNPLGRIFQPGVAPDRCQLGSTLPLALAGREGMKKGPLPGLS